MTKTTRRVLSFAVRHWIVACLTAAALLTATGLGVGFTGDDCYHLLILQGEKTPAVDGNLYTFAIGDAAVTKPFIEVGPLPWWTLPELRVVFFRPLSTWVHRLDYSIFGLHAVFWHLHAMLWYLVLVLGWALIARRILPEPIAALAVLIFAIDEVHWMPAVWLANRNAVIACTPVVFALYAHIRWREQQWRLGLPLSVAGYVVGMLGGEAWLGIVAYVAGYELVGRSDSWRKRAASLAPAAICAIGYALLYKLLGYGVDGSGSYLQPLSVEYLMDAPSRSLALLGGLLLSSPVDIWAFLPGLRPLLMAVGAVGVAVFARLLYKTWAAQDDQTRRTLRWLIVGGVMSLAPVIAAFPMNRLLLGPSIAASAVVAAILRQWWVSTDLKRTRLFSCACAVVAFLNLGFAPLDWAIQSTVVSLLSRAADRTYMNAPLDDATIAGQDVILLAANEPMTLMYPPILRRLNGRPLPGSWHALSASPHDHVFTRTGETSFELETKRGALVQGVFAEILRNPSIQLKVGDTVELRNMLITVLEITSGAPSKISVDCARRLEDDSLIIFIWEDFELKRFAIPPVGESREIRYFSKKWWAAR